VAWVVNDEPIRYLSARTILANSWHRDTMFANDMPAKLFDTSVILKVQVHTAKQRSDMRVEVNLLHWKHLVLAGMSYKEIVQQ
jgi:hypothetical protein